jgi:hypothetical protein
MVNNFYRCTLITLKFLFYQQMHVLLTLNLLTTTIVAPPSNASKWQMGFNSAFKCLNIQNVKIYIEISYIRSYMIRYIRTILREFTLSLAKVTRL